MEKFTNEELLEVLPTSVRETKELTSKQKVVLGQLLVYNGLEIAKKDGYFYRSNKDLCNDCEIQEKTLISAVRKLETLGFIERKKGARTSGASEYRINEKMIGDYCKNDIEDYSNDYSKQIAEMTSRIKELEITVKMLVDRITVIEGKNYSTDKDKEIDIDIEKELDNNILIEKTNSLYKKLGESESIKELEKGESGETLTVFQPVLTESQASSPIEESFQASLVTDSADVEETHIPTEDEQYQAWIQSLEPLFSEYTRTSTIAELDNLKDKTVQAMREYDDKHQFNNEKLNWRIAGVVADKYSIQRERIETKNQKIVKLFKYQTGQLS